MYAWLTWLQGSLVEALDPTLADQATDPIL
jgi:hypothetical protein